MDSAKIATLKKMVENSNKIVFFGGAGVSTESGIPDFRSTDGLYNQQYQYPPETIVSHHFLEQEPAEFFRFYRSRMLYKDAVPNAAHRVLARLEQIGKLRAVVTQNIDGLHQAAGSKTVFELHGSVHRNYCKVCKKKYSLADVLAQSGIPRCSCGGIIRPDVVLYEEPLDDQIVRGAIAAIAAADTLIVGGTSLVVYPAASLVTYFHGRNLIVINKSATPMDQNADLVIADKIGETLSTAFPELL